MREKPEVGEKPGIGDEPKKKRVDLSVPQVAGSAVAAVVAAKLASYFGVYGTILGAGLVSIVATCGGTLFQHFFRRTGEQIRDVAVQTKPQAQQAPAVGEFTEGTVYRARVKRWRRPVLAAALVFGVTMAGITTYELVSGSSFSGGSSTTVGDALTGHEAGSSTPEPDPTPSAGSSQRSSDGTGAPQGSAGGATPGSMPTPGSPRSAGTGTPADSGSGAPTPTPSATTSPAPDASSRSQSADPGQAAPSTP